VKQKHFIDIHKGFTGLFVLFLIAYYQRWNSTTAWIYLALHGTYGMLWVLKSRIFPDRQWEQNTGIGYGLIIWGSLSLYWAAPWLLMARGIEAPAWYLALCVSIFSFGVFFHFAADMQKTTALTMQPHTLITDRLFARSRNMNYFGELLIYTGFGLLAMHWLPILILLAWVLFLWLPNMRKKDRSLSRYENFESYREQSKLFIPYIY
jgi:protein-S-isoprenylcysteine O-methyltransferase Ste14